MMYESPITVEIYDPNSDEDVCTFPVQTPPLTNPPYNL